MIILKVNYHFVKCSDNHVIMLGMEKHKIFMKNNFRLEIIVIWCVTIFMSMKLLRSEHEIKQLISTVKVCHISSSAEKSCVIWSSLKPSVEQIRFSVATEKRKNGAHMASLNTAYNIRQRMKKKHIIMHNLIWWWQEKAKVKLWQTFVSCASKWAAFFQTTYITSI